MRGRPQQRGSGPKLAEHVHAVLASARLMSARLALQRFKERFGAVHVLTQPVCERERAQKVEHVCHHLRRELGRAGGLGRQRGRTIYKV